MKKKLPYVFRVNTEKEYREALNFVHNLTGAEINDGDGTTTIDRWVETYPFRGEFKFVGLNPATGRLTSWSQEATHPTAIDFSDNAKVGKIIKEWSNPKTPIIVKGVGEYTATITSVGVQVGCQTIPFEKVQEIAKGIEEFLKQ